MSSLTTNDPLKMYLDDIDPDCPLPCCRKRPFAVLDVETTGLDHKTDRIVEIAIVPCDPDGLVDGESFTTLVNPQGPVGATHIHGITADDVASAPTFADIAGDVVDRLAGRVLVAHNALFDVRFLNRELTRAARQCGDIADDARFPLIPAMCTMRTATRCGFDHYTSLARLCDAIDYRNPHPHAALGDALATAHALRYILVDLAFGYQGEVRYHARPFGDPDTPVLDATDFPALGRTAGVLGRRLGADTA